MPARRLALLLSLAACGGSLAACGGPRAARPAAADACPAARPLLAADACPAARPLLTEPAAETAAQVRAAAYLRLAGAPAQALARLRPLAAQLDAAGLAELARAEAAAGDAAAASRSLERAAARAEQQHGERGRWRWQRGGAEPVVRLAFTPDGARLASADREGTIRIWDVAGGHELRKLEVGRWPSIVAISPNGRWLAAAGGNGPLQVWSVATGKRVLELPFEAPAAFTPDGTLVAGTPTNVVELAIPSGQELGRFGAASPSALAVGEHIYTSYENDARQRVLTTWERGRAHRQLGEAVLPAGVWELQRTASGELVMSFGDKLAITDERGHARLTLGAYQSLALTPDGRHLLASPARGGADLIELASGKVLRHLDIARERPALAVHPRGGLIAVAEGAQISLARLDTGAPVARLGAPTPRLAVAFDPSGDRLAVGADTDVIAAWDLRGGGLDAAAPRDPDRFAWRTSGVRSLRERERAEAALDDGRVVPVDAKAEVAAVQPGGRLLASAGDDGRIALWDTAAGAPLRVLLDGGAVAALAWAPDGRTLASAAGPAVALWDPRSGARLASLAAHAPITSLAFRPDGRTLAVACDDGLVELWAVATRALVATLAAPAAGRGLVLAPDGAVDGALADGDPLYWTAGDATLPARAVWDREARPGLLAARLATVPAETAPRPGLPGAAAPPDPPACFARGPDDGPTSLVSVAPVGAGSISLCVEHVAWSRKRPELPACFVVDLTSGTYRPRPAEPDEVLGRSGPRSVTAKVSGEVVTVCKDGACRELAVPELTGAGKRGVAEVNAAGTLVAVRLGSPHSDDDDGDDADDTDDAASADDDEPSAAAIAIAAASGKPIARARRAGRAGGSGPLSERIAVVYDVARGRRLGRVDLGEPHVDLGFIDDTLLVTSTPCAGPCSSSALVDPRTGKRLAMVGGSEPINTSELDFARVSGDVYAFNDHDSNAIVYQDVRSGRVVSRFDHAGSPCQDVDCGRIVMVHTGGRLAVIQAGGATGDLTLYDPSGRHVSSYRMPVCAGAGADDTDTDDPDAAGPGATGP
jgi:WD40 repeat protein